MKNLFIIIFSLFLIINESNSLSFNTFIEKLEELEKYAKEYKQKTDDSSSIEQLLLSYIRQKKYNGFEWTVAAGTVSEKFSEYINDIDNKNNSKDYTKISSIKSLSDLETGKNGNIDIIHLFAVMNGIFYTNQYNSDKSQLVGWAGDLEQLFEDIHLEKGNITELINLASNFLGIKGQFGSLDLKADLDAPILVNKRKENQTETFASIINKYYNNKIDDNERVNQFIEINFPYLVNKTKDDFRNLIFKEYSNNIYIPRLECKSGFRNTFFSCAFISGYLKNKYKDHQKAVAYTFADYLYNHTNYHI